MTHPPRLLQRFIEAVLPPSRREHILGDLEERYRSSASGGALGYFQDAFHVVPRLIADQLKRGCSNWSCISTRVSFESASADLRVRAAAYQDYIWKRNVHAILGTFILMAAAMLASVFDPRWTLADVGSVALAIGWTCGTYQLYFRRGHANPIPPGMSLDELRGFQRGELCRQVSINWNLLLYWIVPGPLFVIAYGAMIGRAAVLLSGLIPLAAILLQARIIASRRRRERVEFEKELARLERESLKPVS